MMGRLRILVVTGAAAALVAETPAAATISKHAEPAFTKATSNTWWFGYQTGSASERYCFYWRAGNGPFNAHGCSGIAAANTSGNLSVQRTGLSSGQTYAVAADQYVSDGSGGWIFYPCAGTGQCTSTTTIDLTQPSSAVTLAGGAQYTRDATLPIRIDYADALSPPWPGPNGVAFTYGCLARGGPCAQPPSAANGWAWHQACSQPVWTGAGGLTSRFDCQWDLSAQADGRYHYCVTQADSALPDNPNGPNQFGATADQANLSAVACDDTTLDRGAPSVSASASATSVTTGELVTFTAAASDSLSGLSGAYTWTFGDNTAPASGSSTSHTYTQPGTYVAKVATTDGAGNAGEGTVTITVAAPPPPPDGGQPAGDAGGGGQTAPPPDAATTTASGGGTTTSDGGTTTTGGTSGATPTSTTTVVREIQTTAVGGTQRVTLARALQVLAPRRYRPRGRRPRLVLALTARTAGRAQVVLLRRTRIVATRTARLGRPGTYAVRLRLPRRPRPGTYRLRVTFTPAGARRATTRTVKLRVLGPRRRARRATVHAARSAPPPPFDASSDGGRAMHEAGGGRSIRAAAAGR